MTVLDIAVGGDGYQPIGLEEANKRLRSAQTSRRKYEVDWFLNLAFFQGEQWVAHDGRALYYPKMRRGAVRLVDNRIQPIVRTEVARLSKTRPGWAAAPRALDDQAINDAAASTRLLEWGYDHLNFPHHRHEAINWARICGAGFIEATWNKHAGESQGQVVVQPDGAGGHEAVMHPVTKRALRPGELPEIEQIEGVEVMELGKGEVELCVRSPFEVFPDPLATSLEDARWVILESVRSPEYVQERYGKSLQPDAPAQVGIVESGFHRAGVDAASGENLGIKVYELWEPPSGACPTGRRMAWACGQVLYEGPNEYGGIPLTMFPGIIVPGRFWPDAVVTQLRPIQARWNKMLSQLAENLSKFGSPTMLVDGMAGINIQGVPGEVAKYTIQGQRPPVEYLTPPSVPGYSFNFMEQMGQSLREISGQYEVSQGTVPAGVTAASAISLLQEQDATRLGPDVEQIEVALGKVGQQVIRLMARYYTTDRIVVIVGEDGIVDVDSVRLGATFQVPDITVQPMSTFPRSIAAKQSALRDMLNMLLQYGVPLEASALAKVLKDFGVGGLENLVATTVEDTNAAQREHVELMRGTSPTVREVDNDAVHIAIHEGYMKSPRCTPDQYAVLLQHNDDHRKSAVAKAQRDQALAGAAAPPAPIVGQAPPQLPPGAPPTAVPTQPSGNPMPMDGPPPDQMAA